MRDSGEFFTDLALLVFTFTMAWNLRAFKDSTLGTKFLRKLVGNFAVVMSIIIMSGLAYILTPFNTMQAMRKTLHVPDVTKDGLRTTRYPNDTHIRLNTWFVNPWVLSTKWILASIFPAILLFIVIFLETSMAQYITFLIHIRKLWMLLWFDSRILFFILVPGA